MGLNFLLDENKPSCVCVGVTEFNHNDKKQLGSLFEENQRKLTSFVRSKVSNPCDVDDLVQETFFQAQKSIDSFERKATFSTWIFGIALNLIKNHYSRSPEHRFEFTSGEDMCDLFTPYGLPENEALKSDRFDRLLSQINLLPSQGRDVLLMVAVDEVSYEEVADRLGLTVSTVKSRLFRARRQLRDELELYSF